MSLNVVQRLERCNAALKTPFEISEKGNFCAEKGVPDNIRIDLAHRWWRTKFAEQTKGRSQHAGSERNTLATGKRAARRHRLPYDSRALCKRCLRKWQPAVNAYRCEEGFAVCVDLAGMDKESIDVKVEQRRLRIRGHRQSPEPKREKHRPVQVLMMEIDSGNFERELTFSVDIDGSQTTAEQQNGLLWIFLPLSQGA